MMAVGVASPSAHGQETTSTAMPIDRAKSKLSPSSSQTTNAIRAMPMTMGTNTPLTLSASLAMGALEADASSTRAMTLEKAVSSPTCSARTSR